MANNPMPPANLVVLEAVVLEAAVLEAAVLEDREVWGPAEEKEANLARAVVSLAEARAEANNVPNP